MKSKYQWADMRLTSMPQPENHAVQHELQQVIAAIDQPQLQAAPGEGVVDAEAGGDEGEAHQRTVVEAQVQRRGRAEQHGERNRRHQSQHERAAEYAAGMAHRL